MFSVREATAADRPEILSLIDAMIPGCDLEARWRWLYETNPGGRAVTWLAIAPSGEIAGCTSHFPFRLMLDGEVVRAALGGDGYVWPKFRRRGLGGMMHDASRTGMVAHGLSCMYGAPGAMNLTPLKHGGSRELGTVARFVRPLRIGPRAGALDQVAVELLRPRFVATLSSMAPHDPRVDAVWAEAKRALRIAAVRDAAFYTWRFLEAPAQCEPAFVIVEHGTPIGACSLEPMNQGKDLHIVDLVAVPGAWHACLRAIVRHAADTTRATTVSIKLFSLDGRNRQMWRSGFIERANKPFLCMIPKDGDRRFLDPQRWFYAGGDSDLDSLA